MSAAATHITRIGTVLVPVGDRGDFVPPMFTFRDPDGNRYRVVERE